jgi:hypothetical protein
MGAWFDYVSYIAENYDETKCFAQEISNDEYRLYDFLGFF